MLTPKQSASAVAVALLIGLAGCGGGGGGGDAPAASTPSVPTDSTTPTTPTTPTDSSTPSTPTTPTDSSTPTTPTTPATPTPPDPATPPPPVVPPAVPLAGSMVDGYVNGATVVCDANANGVADPGEARASTNAQGSYSFPDCKYPVIGTGGTDVSTGFPFTGVLRSPVGSAYMTPLTTLVTGTGLSTEQLNRLLSLPDGTDPTQADPTKDLNLFRTTLAVQQLIAQLAATIQAAGGGDLSAIYAKVAASLADTLRNAPAGTTLISASGLNLDLLIAVAKSAAGATAFSAADLAALCADIKGQSEKFLSATSLASLVSLAKVLQDPAIKVDPNAGTRFFALRDDAILFGGQPYTLADLASPAGVVISSLDTIGLRVDVAGVPTVGTSGVALSMTEQGGSGRALKVMLDKVKFVLTPNNQLLMTVAQDAKVYLYGRKANGATVSLSGPLGTIQKPVSVVNNTLTLDYSAVVKRLTGNTSTSLQSFLNVTGTFQITATISNFNLRKAGSGALEQTVVTVDDTAGTLSGVGLTGKVTVLGY